ncbi:hypothetical protein WME90_42960 [Sorangium sp. So ce375]|uniref:hypothetical protein n=1 Tax=Sorangium sp. So ce375 TaxID=3133306 RepID=UPI003F5B5E71
MRKLQMIVTHWEIFRRSTGRRRVVNRATSVSPKMLKAKMSDLATCFFVERREDVKPIG